MKQAMITLSPTLQTALQAAALTFTHGVLEAIQRTPLSALSEIGAPSGKAKRVRRSSEDLAETLGLILALLEEHPEGLRTEQIRVKLGLPRAKLLLPLAKGVEAGVLSKSGHKRTTVFKVKSES